MTHYPTCRLHEVAQRSPEWFEARKGYLTASQFGDWLTKAGKVAEKAKLTAASKVLAEMAGYPDPPPFVNDDMQRGIDLEPTARRLFEDATLLEVREIGFATSTQGYFGCSPDGLVSDGGGLEIKIPRASKLIQYHENGELPEEYRAQVHGSMAAPGFMKPEGVVVFHVAGNVGFKKTIEDDESPKSLAR
jgi:hypothetical protein